jgi:hypothetical protein
VDIPSANVMLVNNLFYNPPGYKSQWQHIQVGAARGWSKHKTGGARRESVYSEYAFYFIIDVSTSALQVDGPMPVRAGANIPGSTVVADNNLVIR